MLIVFCIDHVQLFLPGVETVVHKPEDNTRQERRDGQANKHPHDGRVVCGGGQGLSDGRSECIGEQVH